MPGNHLLSFILIAEVFVILLSTHASAASELDIAMQSPANWAHSRGQYNNQGYSELNQINTRNVKNLKLAWTFSTGVNRGHEGAPLVIDGVMYLHTAFPNNVYALDLNNDQKILWSYFPKQDPGVKAAFCCDNVNRGLGFGDGKIFLQQNNGVLVALNAKTGKLKWQVQVNDPKTGATNSNAPQVIKDKVLTGCAGGEFGVRCFIAAYFLKDGALAWKAYSTGSDADVLIDNGFNVVNPQYSVLNVYENVNGGNKPGGSFKPIASDQLKTGEKDLGVRTWLKPQQLKDGWQNGGGAVTGYFAYDRKTNLVYYGTGNPGTWNPDVRPGDNKWTSSIFARDLDSGMAKWAMQATPHDEWDYDATNEIILFEKNRKRYATQINKNGFLYTWQADNGTLAHAEKVHPFVNWATGVDLKTGVPAKDARFNTHTDIIVKWVCPSTMGAKGFAPGAYSPKTALLYFPLLQSCTAYQMLESKYIAGQPWVSAATLTLPNGEWGAFIASDPMTGRTVWRNEEKIPATSGVLASATNVVFYGTMERWFKAVDATSGKALWKFQVGSGVLGNPFSYQLKGKQYIGVLSGSGGVWRDPAINEPGICAEVHDFYRCTANPEGAGALNIFSL